MSSVATLFKEVMQKVANDPLVSHDMGATAGALLKHAAEVGLTLEQCSSPLYMDRSLRTLQKYCRRYGIRFPDYIPYKTRSAEERKRGPRKKKGIPK